MTIFVIYVIFSFLLTSLGLVFFFFGVWTTSFSITNLSKCELWSEDKLVEVWVVRILYGILYSALQGKWVSMLPDLDHQGRDWTHAHIFKSLLQEGSIIHRRNSKEHWYLNYISSFTQQMKEPSRWVPFQLWKNWELTWQGMCWRWCHFCCGWRQWEWLVNRHACQSFDDLPWLGLLTAQGACTMWNSLRRAESLLSSQPSYCPSCPTQARGCLLHLAERIQQEMWEFSTQPWQTGGKSKAGGSLTSFLGFRLSDWKGELKWGIFFPLVFHL